MSEPTELYRKYRPTTWDSVFGNAQAIAILRAKCEQGTMPHALMLCGPSGTGKTTTARIVKDQMGCSDTDFVEINAADARGIDTIRDIRRVQNLSAMQKGSPRMWLIDESHKLTNDAQTVLLKMLEDPPAHVYFILATTEPNKHLKTILTRCTQIQMELLGEAEMRSLVIQIAELEGRTVGDLVLREIVEAAEGSPRKALVILDQVLTLADEQDQLKAVLAADAKQEAISICRFLMKGGPWKEMSAILKAVEGEPESIRYLVLSYFTTVLLNSGNPRAAMILDYFADNFYDSKKAGLVLACFNVLRQK